MVFLGLGASRHLIGLYDDLAASMDLRLICIDRWGIGRTDSVPMESRNILGWSLIVEQIANFLGIGRFSVLAHSAGAPFAAALALLFPERIQGPLHLLAPWTGVQQDSGYRWLRYVPEGVIKTAQAADSRIQNWKLSKDGSRTANKTVPSQADGGYHARRRYGSDEAERRPTPPPKEAGYHSGVSATDKGSLTIRSSTRTSSDNVDSIYKTATRDAVDGTRPSWTQEGEEDTLQKLNAAMR